MEKAKIKKEIIFKEDAIDAIAKSEYYLIGSDGRGIDENMKRSAAKEIIDGAKPITPTPWLIIGGKRFLCSNCDTDFDNIDLLMYRHCPYCAMPHEGAKEKGGLR